MQERRGAELRAGGCLVLVPSGRVRLGRGRARSHTRANVPIVSRDAGRDASEAVAVRFLGPVVSERLSGTLGPGSRPHGGVRACAVEAAGVSGAPSAVDVEAHPQLDARGVALAHDELVAALGDDAQARA